MTSPERKRTLLLGGALVLVALATLLSTHNWGLGRTAGGEVRHPSLLEDAHDRSVYQRVGRWAVSEGTPYIEEYSIYPQLTTWFLAIPYLLIDHSVVRGEPHYSKHRARAALVAAGVPEENAEVIVGHAQLTQLPAEQVQAGLIIALAQFGVRLVDVDEPLQATHEAMLAYGAEIARDSKAYGDVFHVLAALLLLAHLALSTRILERLGHSPAWALLALLPASLFFSFNRLDLLVVCTIEAALLSRLAGRPAWTGFWLGCAIMVKWYPVVLVPAFLSYGLWTSLGDARREGRPAPLRGLLLRQVVLPGLVAGLVCLACLTVTFFQDGGGVEAVMHLPRWHSETREPNHAALVTLITMPDRLGWFPYESRDGLMQGFFYLQLVPGLLLGLLPIRSFRRLLQVCLVATMCSVLFSRFYSPQWVLWTAMITLLLAPERRRYLWVPLLLEIVIYIQLPVLVHGPETAGAPIFWAVTYTRVALLVTLLAMASADLARDIFRDRHHAGTPVPTTV